MKKKVVVIGSLNYDTFLKIPHLVAEGENLHATSLAFGLGGKGANQAVQCAKLGIKTYMVGAVGDDEVGKTMLKGLSSFGVDTSFVRVTNGPSGQAFVFSAETGAVQGVVVKGANWEVRESDVDEVLPIIDEDTFVVLQMEIPLSTISYAIDRSFEKGAKVVFNAAPAVAIDEKYFGMTCLSVFNETEASFYLGHKLSSSSEIVDGVQKLGKKLSCNCLITAGKDGAYYYDGDSVLHRRAEDAKVVETTGAGDSFIGGFIYGLCNGFDTGTCLDIASKCSAVTISKIGAQESMPYLKDI